LSRPLPSIRALCSSPSTWMPGTSPGTTAERVRPGRRIPDIALLTPRSRTASSARSFLDNFTVEDIRRRCAKNPRRCDERRRSAFHTHRLMLGPPWSFASTSCLHQIEPSVKAARRRVCFQPCVEPSQAISATTWPNQNLCKLRGKNPPAHRREYFRVTLLIVSSVSRR
jgi:hypothetical protein